MTHMCMVLWWLYIEHVATVFYNIFCFFFVLKKNMAVNSITNTPTLSVMHENNNHFSYFRYFKTDELLLSSFSLSFNIHVILEGLDWTQLPKQKCTHNFLVEFKLCYVDTITVRKLWLCQRRKLNNQINQFSTLCELEFR